MSMNMKLKYLLALSLIPLSTHAAMGHDYQILSEKVTVTPGIEASSMDVTGSKKNFYTTIPVAQTNNYSTKINQPIRVSGYHEVSIQNTTRTKQIYRYIDKIWIGTDSYQFERKVEVKSGGVFMESRESAIGVLRSLAGNYQINVQTLIGLAENNVAEDTKNLFVH